MKRVILFFAILFMSIGAYSQHLNFMGIPIDGNITKFDQQILNKGFVHDTEMNEYVGRRGRAYKGIFFGEDASIYVYCNPKTQVVYKTRVCISKNSESQIKNLFDDIKSSLQIKYDSDFNREEEGTIDGYEAYELGVYREDYAPEGQIFLSIDKSTIKENYYTLYIDYTDFENNLNNDNSKDEDL